MSIEPISANEKVMPLADAVRKVYQQNSEHGQAKKVKEQPEEAVSVSLQRAAGTMGRLVGVNEEINLVAKGIRETDGALQQASGLIDQMKTRLEKVIKNFPPFSADSQDRRDLLMSYSSLRKEILKLTFPPPPSPVYEKNTSLWEKLGYNDQNKLAVAVPELSASASHEQVKAVSTSLDGLQADVSEGIRELVRTVTE